MEHPFKSFLLSECISLDAENGLHSSWNMFFFVLDYFCSWNSKYSEVHFHVDWKRDLWRNWRLLSWPARFVVVVIVFSVNAIAVATTAAAAASPTAAYRHRRAAGPEPVPGPGSSGSGERQHGGKEAARVEADGGETAGAGGVEREALAVHGDHAGLAGGGGRLALEGVRERASERG
jgi:hypothetical protein